MVSSNDLCHLAPRIALLCTLAYGSNNNSFSAEFKISQKNQGTTLKKKTVQCSLPGTGLPEWIGLWPEAEFQVLPIPGSWIWLVVRGTPGGEGVRAGVWGWEIWTKYNQAHLNMKLRLWKQFPVKRAWTLLSGHNEHHVQEVGSLSLHMAVGDPRSQSMIDFVIMSSDLQPNVLEELICQPITICWLVGSGGRGRCWTDLAYPNI